MSNNHSVKLSVKLKLIQKRLASYFPFQLKFDSSTNLPRLLLEAILNDEFSSITAGKFNVMVC